MALARHRFQSRCECQALLSALVDERCQVLSGSALNRERTGEAPAPAIALGGAGPDFQIAWLCPFCTRNVVRSVSASGFSTPRPTPETG